jgi:hypothetical protein
MRTLTIVRIATSLGALACTLACAGIWKDVHRESFSEMSIRLADLPGLEPTRRAEAQALLEDGWIAAHEGRMDFSTAVMFDVAFDEALEDGALSGLDIEVLRDASSTFVSPELTPERRSELVAYLAEMDAEQRRVLGRDGGAVAPVSPRLGVSCPRTAARTHS